MPAIVAYTDFTTGPFKMTFSTFQQADFSAYVTAYEKEILRDLLSDKLQYEIFAAATLTGKYADLINGVGYTDSDGVYRTNIGLKEVLKRFIYYFYCKDSFQVSTTGKTNNQNENATPLTLAENRAVIYSKYNEGVDLWNADLLHFLDNYSIQEKTIDSYTDLGGSYSILSSDTGYLVTGDTVRINGQDYVVASVVVNTSFVITGTGLTPSGNYTFEPFLNVDIKELEHAYL